MAFEEMYNEIIGMVPKLPVPYAKSLVNRAWQDIRRQNLWSFQLYEGPQWLTPGLITGTLTANRGFNTVVIDATSAALINAIVPTYSYVIQRQLRVGGAGGTIYNIIAWNGVDTLTLDRLYGEADTVATPYSIFQCYYAAPYLDHLMFISVRNMQNFIDLFINKTRAQIDEMDPQRSWYYFPTDVVYYRTDTVPTSPTYRYPLYELWGIPQATYTYNLYGIRKGSDLSLMTDTLPPQIGEDCVIAQAKYYAFEWAEAHKEPGAKNDFKFLMGAASAEYKRLFREYRRQDRETINLWFSVRRTSLFGKVFAYYSSVSGTAYPGTSL